MTRETVVILILLALTSVSGALAATVLQERKSKKVRRVKRPVFTQNDWDGVYFTDLFSEGLVGPRPDSLTPALNGEPKLVGSGSTPSNEGSVDGPFKWTRHVSGTTLEDEVKALQQQLNLEVTTPVKFRSDYGKVHQSFALLSMLFGIIREYDGDVRWKRFSADAQISFERAAANSRVGTIQAYESCKRRKGDLEEMVRGGNFAPSEKPPESLDWSAVIDRTPMMKRLQVSKDTLKQLSANPGEFSDGIETVLHESELISAMAQALMRENMTDADDEGYQALAQSMSEAALATRDACLNQDYDAAAKAINRIDQSCNNCHDEWK